MYIQLCLVIDKKYTTILNIQYTSIIKIKQKNI